MADSQRTIDLVFNGVDKTGAATAAALSNTRNFADGLQTATQPIANFTTSALKLEAGLLATGAAITAFAIKTAGDFDTAFREISTLIDAPIDAINDFRQAILDYASTSTKPLEDVTSSIYTAISAGVDFEQSISAVSTAERLAVASKADLNDSLLVIVSSLNAYGLGMEDADRFSDALFQTVKNGQTTLPELAASLSDVTGTAATIGVPFETLLSALAALTSTGTSTNKAVTQINAALSAILAPSTQAAKLAEELGLEFNAQAVRAKGLEVVLQEVAQATGGSEEQLQKLFGSTEALRAVFPLTGSAASTFADNLRDINDSAGSTQEAFEKMAGGIENATQLVKNSITGALINVGTPLLDEFGGVAQAIAGIFQALGQNVSAGNLGEVVGFIEAELAGLQTTLEAVARNLPAALEQADLSGFTDGLRAISDAVGNLFDGVDLTTVDGLASAIESVGAAFELLSNFSGGAIESFRPLFQQLTGIGSTLLEISPEIAKTAGEFSGFATQANILSGAIVGMLPSIEALLGLLVLNQGASLLGAVNATASALGGSSGLVAALGKLSAVGAAGAAGFGIGTLVDDLSGIGGGEKFSQTLSRWAGEITGLNSELEALGASLNTNTSPSAEAAAKSIAEADREMAALAGTAKSSSSSVLNFSSGLSDLGDAADKLPQSNLNQFFEEGVGELLPYTSALDDAGESTNRLVKETRDSAGTFSVVSMDIDKAAKSVLDLSSASDELKLEAALAGLEAQTAITTTEIEANAKKTIAAFESIDNSVTSTGDTLGELFGLLGDDNISKFNKLDISKAAKAEEERRQTTFKLQKRLTEQQIRLNDARLKALNNGDALIKIDGDGLAPHLEAFMYEILTAIQVRVNQDGYELLLGADS